MDSLGSVKAGNKTGRAFKGSASKWVWGEYKPNEASLQSCRQTIVNHLQRALLQMVVSKLGKPGKLKR